MKHEEWARRKAAPKRPVNLLPTGPRVATEQEVEQEFQGLLGTIFSRMRRKAVPAKTIIPVQKAAPPRVVTLRELEFRRRDTRANRAKRHRAAS